MNNEKWKDVTKEHFAAMQKHHKLTSYLDNDINELITLVRLYVDPRQASCVTCHNNLREAKNKLNGFYSTFRDQIENNLRAPESEPEIIQKPLTQIEAAQEQVIQYKEEDEKKKRGRKPKIN